MDKKQKIQNKQYNYPYHHVCEYDGKNFSQTKSLSWGYEYMSYVHFVINLIKNKEYTSLLDLGCGDGKFLLEVNKNIENLEIVGIDYSKEATTLAQYFNPTLEIKTANILDNSPFNRTFDVITLIEVLEHIDPKDIPSFLKATKELLSPNGEIIVTVPSDNLEVQEKHHQHFNKTTLTKALESHFEVIEVHYLNTISYLQYNLARVLHNKCFILNNQRSLNKIFDFYNKHYLLSSAEKCKRLCIVAKRKQ